MESQQPASDDWRRRSTLGLPPGSIRALLALLLFGTIWGVLLLQPDRDLPAYLRDLLFIILGHYFAARKRAETEAAGGPPPLFLPRGTVRLVLIAGFVLVTALLYRQGHVDGFDTPASVALLLVGGFLLGVIMSRLTGWLTEGQPQAARLVEDFKAIVALGAAAALIMLVWDHVTPFLPLSAQDALDALRAPLGRVALEELLAATLGFYFGTRS